MSSGIRTLEKRIMKAKGYVRQTQKILKDPDGTPRVIRLKKGEGPIVNPAGDPWNGTEANSRHWPMVGDIK